MRLAVAVMAHPSRKAEAMTLAGSLGRTDVRVVLDPRPDDPPQTLRTSIAVWSTMDEDATHQLVLQDDAIVPDGLLSQVESAVAAKPDDAIALYSDWSTRNGAAVRLGTAVGASWVRAVRDYTPCVALVLPRAVVQGFVAYARANDPDEPDDQVMVRYLRESGCKTYLTVPNMVAHDDLPSLVGNGIKGRRDAACYLGTMGSTWNPNARTLEGFEALPYLKDGEACLFLRTDEPADDWDKAALLETLPAMGLELAALDREFAAALDRLPVRVLAELRVEIPQEQLRGVWVTAFLIGHWRRSVVPVCELWHAWGGRADERLLRRSMHTLAIGGLFPVVSHEVTVRLGAECWLLAADGLAAGSR